MALQRAERRYRLNTSTNQHYYYYIVILLPCHFKVELVTYYDLNKLTAAAVFACVFSKSKRPQMRSVIIIGLRQTCSTDILLRHLSLITMVG